MRDRVLHTLAGVFQSRRDAERAQSRAQSRARVDAVRQLDSRRLPHAMQQLARPPLHQPAPAPRDQRDRAPHGDRRAPRRNRRQLIDDAAAPRHAERSDRTIPAQRRPRQADGRAQLHQGLIPPAGGAHRNECFCPLPQEARLTRVANAEPQAEQAREHPGHIPVENRHSSVESYGENRSGGVAPDARKAGKCFGPIGNARGVFAHHESGGIVQQARPAVVAEAGPRGSHVIERRGGE